MGGKYEKEGKSDREIEGTKTVVLLVIRSKRPDPRVRDIVLGSRASCNG